jgi:phosphoribosyl-ATP pyrophosphohydrolase/phosphoribosyl-AMP cyclohydrolase
MSSSAEKILFLTQLQDLLDSRKIEMPEGSYTSKLFAKGTDKIAQKVGEEAIETVIAAKNDNEELLYEASDLLFHLMVLLTDRGLRIEDLADELQRRHK